MMAELIPLDASRHRGHGWKRTDSFRFAAEDGFCPKADSRRAVSQRLLYL